MKRLALGMACASALAWCSPARSDEPNQDPAKLFESLDKNNDGILTADEVGEDRKRFFERLVRVGDKNDDKKLSKEEFVASMSEQEKPVATPQGRFGPGGDRPMFSPGQMFERMDRNRDGKFTKDEIPEQAPAEMRERMEMLFTAAKKSELTKDEFEKTMAKYGPPMGRPDGRRPEGAGDRPRPDGERGREMARGEDRKPTDRDGDRGRGPEGERGRMEGRDGGGRTGGFSPFGNGRPMSPLIRVLDRNDDGKLSRKELANAAERFEELDRNGDGELDMAELLGIGPMFGGGFGGPNNFAGRPGFGGPEGMRREGGDRDREMARDGDRRPEERRDGDRRADGPRDGERPRPEAMRDGDRRPEGPRDGDRPRPDGRLEGGPRPGADRGPMQRGGFDFFARLDKNGDGVITKDEAPEKMKNRFPDLDGNGDGKITPEELREALARELGIPAPTEQRRERRPDLE